VKGFQTGDLVKATIPGGKFKETHQGRLAVRARGSFVIQTPRGNLETGLETLQGPHEKRRLRLRNQTSADSSAP
jgi:hypothetical protein